MKKKSKKKIKSDGCTMWLDGPWHDCCVKHDLKYYEGGTERSRMKADIDMLRCAAKTGHPYMAIIMFIGVRLFGSKYWPTRMRWGRKNPYLRKRALPPS